MLKPLTIENFASLVRTGSVTRVHMAPCVLDGVSGWFIEVDHCDKLQSPRLHTKRGSLRVFRTSDAAIRAVQDSGFSRSVVVHLDGQL